MRMDGWKAAVIVLLFASAPAFGASPWGADYFPNVPLTTHEGKTVHFFDDLIKDKIVVINFIYATCPDTCPLETSRLTSVQRILGDRVGKDIFMYSITIDPDHDTPEVLAEYAERYRVGPGWVFLTGQGVRHHASAQETGPVHRGDPGRLGQPQREPDHRQSDHGPLDEALAVREPLRVLATQIGSWLSGLGELLPKPSATTRAPPSCETCPVESTSSARAAVAATRSEAVSRRRRPGSSGRTSSA